MSQREGKTGQKRVKKNKKECMPSEPDLLERSGYTEFRQKKRERLKERKKRGLPVGTCSRREIAAQSILTAKKDPPRRDPFSWGKKGSS